MGTPDAQPYWDDTSEVGIHRSSCVSNRLFVCLSSFFSVLLLRPSPLTQRGCCGPAWDDSYRNAVGPVHAPLRSVRVRRPMAWETAGAWEPQMFEKNKKARYFF